MTFDVLAIGDVSIDEYIKIHDASVVCDIDKENCKLCINYSDKIPVDGFDTTLAGNSNNVGMGTQKLGLSTAVYAEIGDDTNGQLFIDAYKDLGIITDFCLKNKGAPTNVHQIIVFQGERTILSYHHPFEYKIIDWGKPRWIYYSSLPANFEKFQQDLVKYIKKNPDIGICYNPGTYHLRAGLEKLRNILEVVDILMVNKEEAQDLAEGKTIEELHTNLQKLGPKLTVMTDGKNGSSAHDGKEFVTLGILKEEDSTVVDKTGAGDAHSAGVLSAIHYGKGLKEALRWGTINAAGVVKVVGSIAGQKTKEGMEEVVKEAKFTEFKYDK